MFPEGFANRNGDPLPLIVQKSDEGFGYAATDLAAIRDRTDRLGTDLLYVVGAPQSQHLRMSSPWPRWPGGCPTASSWYTWRSGACSTPTARAVQPLRRFRPALDLLDEAVERAGRR